MKKLDIGIIGLSVMGRSLALNMADHGFQVAGFNRSSDVTKNMVASFPHENFTPFYDIKELIDSLVAPRKIMLMIQAGAPVDAVIEQILPLLDEGDILLECGNSFFEDTKRRFNYVSSKGLHYFGVGVSGGEEGARRGPSIMPGGVKEAYKEIQPILESIAAHAKDGKTCCAYIGPGGAGHYVKMVHNGIEYADMQLISEAYLLLKYVGGFTNKELSEIFHSWNQGELNSFLIKITADILLESDDSADGDLIDVILDSSGQKGTGRWTSIESLKQGVDISMITAACNTRVMSNQLAQRALAKENIHGPTIVEVADKEAFIEIVRRGLYTAKIMAYAQGFALMKNASETYEWDLNLGEIASIFRAGCIIQAEFLNDITKAYQRNALLDNLLLDDFFLAQIQTSQDSLRSSVGIALTNGIAIPAMMNAISYLDVFRGMPVGANMIQAQRDYFGAHTFQRTDMEGKFHHEWERHYEN